VRLQSAGQNHVVDELMISFTHDLEMPAIPPGVPPTGCQVELPFVVVMGVEDGRVGPRCTT
jgi:carboxymethylenebutenolidase